MSVCACLAQFMSGRLGLLVNRENSVAVVFRFGVHDIYIRVCPVLYDRWMHW